LPSEHLRFLHSLWWRVSYLNNQIHQSFAVIIVTEPNRTVRRASVVLNRDLNEICHFLDSYFRVDQVPVDPAFSVFVPMVYDPIGVPWQEIFEESFSTRFNGLMLRGPEGAGKIWCICFPSAEVLKSILEVAAAGDLIFSHHPIDMRCGDPRGEKGAGFVPISPDMLRALQDAGISFYSCHIPLDIHPDSSTSDAIVRAIGGTVTGSLLPVENGFAGRLCEVQPAPWAEVVSNVSNAIGIPYVDVTGKTEKNSVRSVAVIAGGAGDVEFYREADRLGADCLIAGEVTSKIDNEIGERKQREIEMYLPETDLVAIGISHAGSEFLVMKEIAPFLERRLDIPALAVAESWWWR
jgi:putative NIF3 family GTP cyclohydrolase 1 type 2